MISVKRDNSSKCFYDFYSEKHQMKPLHITNEQTNSNYLCYVVLAIGYMIKADMKNIDFPFSVCVYKGNKDKDQVDMKGHSQNKS